MEPYADEICDLTKRESSVDGIFIRHILEHNYNWQDILANAVDSFRKRLVLIMFTPFGKSTVPLVRNALLDLSFRKEDITGYFEGLNVREEHLDSTDTQYKLEHVFYVSKESCE